MIRPAVLLVILTGIVFLWYECGEDLGVFCYRIGLGAFTRARSRVLVPVSLKPSIRTFAARNNTECSTLSFTSSTRSITRKASNS